MVSESLRNSWVKSNYGIQRGDRWLKDLLTTILPYINIECDSSDIKDGDLFSFTIIFVNDRNEVDRNRVYVQADWEAEKWVERLVYNDEVEDEKVEFNILEYLDKLLKENNSQPILVVDLIQALYIDPKIVGRALDTLYNNQQVVIYEYKGSIINGKIIITTKGTNTLREMKKQKSIPSGDTYNVNIQSGDFVTGIKNATYGQGSHIIQNSHDVKIINENIDKLLQQLDQDYQEDDKSDILEKVNKIKSLLIAGGEVSHAINECLDLLFRIKRYGPSALTLIHILALFYTMHLPK